MDDINWDTAGNSFANKFKGSGGQDKKESRDQGNHRPASYSEQFLQPVEDTAPMPASGGDGWEHHGEGGTGVPRDQHGFAQDPGRQDPGFQGYARQTHARQTHSPYPPHSGGAQAPAGPPPSRPDPYGQPGPAPQQNGYYQQGPAPQPNGGYPRQEASVSQQHDGYGRQQTAEYAQAAQPQSQPQAEEEYRVSTEERKASASWRYLDLRNKKQTGDLYKKILFYNKKKSDKGNKEYKAISFIASRKGEGVTTILANLVVYMENQRKNILVIDANFQSPSLNRVFNVPDNTQGVMDVFNNRVGLHDAIMQISPNTSFLPSGTRDIKGSFNLEQDHFVELLKFCRKSYDLIFIDCPPVLSSADALSIAPAADLSFLVLQSANVQRPVVERSKILLQNDECELGGVILNRVQQVIPGWLYRYI